MSAGRAGGFHAPGGEAPTPDLNRDLNADLNAEENVESARHPALPGPIGAVDDGPVVDRNHSADRAWLARAVRLIEADLQRSADTHLLRFPLPAGIAEAGIDLYLKDESTHVTGSLKHRLARSLFLYALCNGELTERTTVIESSSGSTAVSEAYFARMIGLPFVAVMPAGTSPEKIALIQAQGGRCHLVDDPAAIYAESRRLAAECHGYYMDQFTFAERATDWRGNNNIAESIFAQLSLERHPVPAWIVVGAGTGGTSATIGRFVRYRGYPTRLCVADPEGSAFFPAWRDADPAMVGSGSRIEGIGRPRVEPSFVGRIVDRMHRVPDAASVGMMRELEPILGRRVGPSTGTGVWACLELAAQMRNDGMSGSIVTLLCDSGDRYSGTYFDDGWVAAQGWDLTPYRRSVREFMTTGRWGLAG